MRMIITIRAVAKLLPWWSQSSSAHYAAKGREKGKKICERDEEKESDNPDNFDESGSDCHAFTGCLFTGAIRSETEYLLSKILFKSSASGSFQKPNIGLASI